MNKDAALVSWFKETFSARTPPTSINDAHPDFRVTWTEIVAKMKDLGYEDSIVLLRVAWANLFVKHRLRAWCNRLIRSTGGKTLVSKEHAAAKEIRESYPDS